MKNFFSRLGGILPKKRYMLKAIHSFSKRERIIFYVLVLALCVTTVAMLERINTSFMVGVPMKGGSISEGIIGTPRFVNPVLALSDADQDLVSLIYSGLMRKAPDGTLVPDLAASYDVSADGLTYTFIMKDGIYFQDGTKVTADDVVFTVNEIKDQTIKSPRKGNWDGVSVEKADGQTVVFTLKQPYASFLENATLGIIPEHVWAGSPIELNNANTEPIGSGPYQVKKVSKEASGIIDYYELAPFKKFSAGVPYLRSLTLYFYPNEDALVTALEDKKVDQISSITPENAQVLEEEGYRVESSVLPRVFGLFFNQSQNQIFTDKNVIMAIDEAVDKDEIVRQVLSGYGVAIDGPIPPNMEAYEKPADTGGTYEERVAHAKDILDRDGWKPGADGFLEKTVTDSKKKKTTTPLSFTISTGNAPELAKSAELVQKYLEAVGMQVDVKTFEIGNLNQSVIRPRKYDALLFGQIINHESDLFAFWHSSQRKDPGLNVAMYTNAKVDKILEDAFTTTDAGERTGKYAQFEDEVEKDMPAVFLYSPSFIYVVSKDLGNVDIGHMISPADRFLNAYVWYTEKDNVWKVFSH